MISVEDAHRLITNERAYKNGIGCKLKHEEKEKQVMDDQHNGITFYGRLA